MGRYALFLVFWIMLFLFPVTAFAEYSQVYYEYVELGKKAIQAEDYAHALEYFELADLINPESSVPRNYIRFIRLKTEKRPQKKVALKKKTKEIDLKKVITVKIKPKKKVVEDGLKKVNEVVDAQDVSFQESPSPKKIFDKQKVEVPVSAESSKQLREHGEVIFTSDVGVVYLNDAVKATQPKTLISLELDTVLIIEGRDIERFLIISPGFFSVKNIDRDHIQVSALKRGKSFLHLWDDQARWTFQVEVILPVRLFKPRVEVSQAVEYAPPFTFHYSVDWGSFYQGDSFESLSRSNLDLVQRLGITGETPYGDADGSVVFYKFDETTEATSYTIGLSNGRIGNFRDFEIRGVDTFGKFSPLTLPGQYFRGILFRSKAFNQMIEYQYVRGDDRTNFGFLSPGVVGERKSTIEGGRVSYIPNDRAKISLNYARGFGEERQDFLNDRVMSVDGSYRFDDLSFSGEVATNEDTLAQSYYTVYQGDIYQLRLNFRDIDETFTTITNLPANRGEVGGTIGFDLRFADLSLGTNLDIYQDRFLPNEKDPDAINFDLSSALDWTLSEQDRLRGAVHYQDTPGELSPRMNFRTNMTYLRHFRVGQERRINTSLGVTYQKSRFPLSQASEYDRYSLSAGLSFPLMRNLNYYVNYEFSWVDEVVSAKKLRPRVLNTGLSYSKRLYDHWTGNASLNYRDEEKTEGRNSFLAGEDSLIGSIGLTYRPSTDFEIFVDGRFRNVWAENADRDAFNEIDVRGGARLSWDMPFRWNPQGFIFGYIYKDVNGNQRRDPGEEGVPGILVRVGNDEIRTNIIGYYDARVSAKRVEVGIEGESLPKGFTLSTPAVVRVPIVAHARKQLDFGLTSQTGIYGVVFEDFNRNGVPEPDETFYSNVKLVLDGERVEVTDYEGIYSFRDIIEGLHIIRVDIHSLPEGYLPLIKLQEEVEVTEGSTFIYHVPVRRIE